MATWRDVAAYIRANYKITDEDDSNITLVFGIDGTRTQIVVLSQALLMDGAEEWVQISSPIARVNQINVNAVLRAIAPMVVGGLAIYGDFLAIRDALPLANLQINELERPMRLITLTADALEKQFVGADVM
ncbi:MAG: hypothetical protein IRY85_23420 [Micromonosporaceae bacterium]|nr:hypothetical protein [Micromonosporaceae bacterium]